MDEAKYILGIYDDIIVAAGAYIIYYYTCSMQSKLAVSSLSLV